MSRIQLRHGKSRSTRLDVDHTVAYALWAQRIKSEVLPDDLEEIEERHAVINRLGNCSLLEKSFNISKSSQPLSAFLEDVRDFQDGLVVRDDWAKALGLTDALLRPDTHTVVEIHEAIEQRDQAIRSEIDEFVTGRRARADLTLPI